MRLGDRALVEGVAALVGEQPQRPRERRVLEDLALARARARRA